MSQEEFSHLEYYLRKGGNILLSADSVIFEESKYSVDTVTDDKKYLDFILKNKAL